MKFLSCMAGLAVVLSVCSAPAFAEDCPASSSQLDDKIEAIEASKGCDAAMNVFEACEYTASGDVQLGAVVEKKCESDFLAGPGAPQKKAYQRELGVCDRKYRNESGTMYLSFTAFCRAQVAQRYSRRARKAAGASAR